MKNYIQSVLLYTSHKKLDQEKKKEKREDKPFFLTEE